MHNYVYLFKFSVNILLKTAPDKEVLRYMIKAAIIGDGYTAAELLRLLAGRDDVAVECTLLQKT